MNKADIASSLADMTGVSKAKAMGTLNALQEIIKKSVSTGQEVRFSGLFNLKVINKSARPARNPSTGAVVTVPAHRAVKIKPAKELTEAAN